MFVSAQYQFDNSDMCRYVYKALHLVSALLEKLSLDACSGNIV